MRAEENRTADKSKVRKGHPYLSVWALFARSSFYKILAALALTAGAEYALFRTWLFRTGSSESLEHMLALLAGPGFLIALGVVYCILILTQRRMEEKSAGLLRRLTIDRTGIFGIGAAYGALCLAMVFAVQIVLAIHMTELYLRAAGQTEVKAQTLFLAFYQVNILHNLLPMAETGKWARNCLIILALGMETTGGTGKSRQVAQVGLFAVTVNWFNSYVGLNVVDVLCDIFCLVFIGVNLGSAGVFHKMAERAKRLGWSGKAV